MGRALCEWQRNPSIREAAERVVQHVDKLGAESVQTEVERKAEVAKFRQLVGTLLTSIAAHKELRQTDDRVSLGWIPVSYIGSVICVFMLLMSFLWFIGRALDG